VLKNELDYLVLEHCKVNDLEELGMPKFHARSLLCKLKEVSSSIHQVATEKKNMGEIIVDAAERPIASELLQQVEEWSRKDDFPSNTLQQEIQQNSTGANCKLLIESDVQCQSEQKRRKISSPVVTEKNYDLGDIY